MPTRRKLVVVQSRLAAKASAASCNTPACPTPISATCARPTARSATCRVRLSSLRIHGRQERPPPNEIRPGAVSENFFNVMGIQPALGRAFRPEDSNPSAPAAMLAMTSGRPNLRQPGRCGTHHLPQRPCVYRDRCSAAIVHRAESTGECRSVRSRLQCSPTWPAILTPMNWSDRANAHYGARRVSSQA